MDIPQEMNFNEEPNEHFLELAEWYLEEERKFKKKLKALKPLLKEEKLVPPLDFSDMLQSYYLDNEEIAKKLDEDIDEIPSISKEKIIEFASNHTEELRGYIKKKFIIPESTKQLKSSIRYQLLQEVLLFRDEFNDLSYEKKDLIFSKILGIHEDTVRHIRERKSRYFKAEDVQSAQILIEKIKKGYYL